MCRVQTTFADLQVDAFCFDLVWFESRLYAVRDRRSLVSDVLMLGCPAACPAAFPPSFLLGSIVCDVFCSLFHCSLHHVLGSMGFARVSRGGS